MCPDIKDVPQKKEMSEADVSALGGLSLAFIGDSVYDLMIRGYILSAGDAKAELLHRNAVKYANAAFQARAAEKLLPMLTEEEAAVYRRGRNAHSAHTPKNKSEAEYHKATGFEALVGWLYLRKDTARLYELFETVLTVDEKEEKNEQKKEIPFNVLAKRK